MLDAISLKFYILVKMRITYSESKVKLVGSGEGFITYLGVKAKVRTKKYKRQGMPLEMSVRRTFQRLLGSLKNYLMKFMRVRGPSMSLLTVTFN